jgi:hypothetical protein
VNRHYAEEEDEGGFFGSIRRLAEDVQVLQADLVEQAVDLGEGAVDYVEEDLGLGDRPDLHRAPPRPSLEIAEEEAEAARERAHDVFSATDGLGTDFTAVRTALTGMNQGQIQVMEQEYFEMTGQNLRAMLDLETSGSDEDEITGLMSGDPVQQAMATLRGATTGVDTEDEVVRGTLRSLTPEQRAEVRTRMGEDYFREQLAGVAEEATIARLEGDEVAAQAAEITDALHGGLTGALGRSVGIEGMGADLETANAVLGEIPEEGRAAYRARLEAEIAARGTNDAVEGEADLTQMIDAATDAGPERDLTHALLDGDRTAVDAARLALNAEGHWYENPAVITAGLMVVCPAAGLAYAAYRAADAAQSGRNPFETADVDEVRSVITRRPDETQEAYGQRMAELETRYARYGGGDPHALDRMIDEQFTVESADHRFLTDLRADGEVSRAAQLRYAFEAHLGTNNEMALRALQDERGNPLPRTEVEAIVHEFRGDLAGEVDGGFWSEMSGDQGFEMRELLRGAPETDAERIEAELRRDEHARGWGLARPLVDLTGSQAGRVMDRQRDELVRLRGEIAENRELSDEDQLALRRALDRHGTAESAYRERVDEATEGTATAVGVATAVTAGILVDALTLGAATPALLALAGAAGGLADLGTRLALLGGRLSNEEIGQRLAATGANAMTAGLGLNGVSGALVSAASDEALRIGTGQRQIEDLADVGAVGLRLGGAAASAHLGDRISRSMGGDDLAGRVLRGGTSGLVRGTLQPLSNVETYEQGLEGALRTMAISAATNVGTGVVQEVAAHSLRSRQAAPSAVDEGDAPPPAVLGPQARTPADVLENLVENVPQMRNRGFFSENTDAAEVMPAGTRGTAFANEGDAGRTSSYSHVGPNGETVVRVATGDGALVIGASDPQLVSTDFVGCGATAIRGRMPDGSEVMLLNHVSQDDHAGHQARLGQDLDRLRRMGVTDLDVTTVVNEAATQPAPAGTHPDEAAAYHDFPHELALGDDVTSRVITHDGGQSVHVVMTSEGTSIFRGDQVEESALIGNVPAPRRDPTDDFRSRLWDPTDRHFGPRTRGEAMAVRSEQGGLHAIETRSRYLARIREIPEELDRLQAEGMSLEGQARRASEVRHEARMVARGWTEDQLRSGDESRRDLAKYGNPDGPSFEDACEQARRSLVRRGRPAGRITDDEVYREVIAAAQRTDARTNAAAGQQGNASNSAAPEETADTLVDEMLAEHRRELGEPYAD